MRHIWRGILFYSFVAIFFIVGIGILLYGTGYRYNPSKRIIEKTGELILETQPRGALVALDARPIQTFFERFFGVYSARTPIHAKYLLPGSYHLTVTKDGYYPFARDISLTSGRVTIINDVELLRNDLPVEIFRSPHIDELIVANNDGVLFRNDSNFFIYDRDTAKIREVTKNEKDAFIKADQIEPPSFFTDKQSFTLESSEFEVWVTDGVHEDTKRLLVRQSTPIQKALLVPRSPFALLASATTLVALEVLDHPDPNRYEIVADRPIGDIVVDREGNHVYTLIRDIKGESIVYQKTLRE